MSSYLGVPFINQVSTTFPKEDFVKTDFGSISVGSTTYAAAVELSIDVPGSESANIEVVLDNIRQEPDTAYTVHENSSSQPRILNFSETVPTGAVIYVIHKGVGPYNLTPPAGSIGSTQLASNLQTFTTDTFTGDALEDLAGKGFSGAAKLYDFFASDMTSNFRSDQQEEDYYKDIQKLGENIYSAFADKTLYNKAIQTPGYFIDRPDAGILHGGNATGEDLLNIAFPIDITISTLIFHGFRVVSSL